MSRSGSVEAVEKQVTFAEIEPVAPVSRPESIADGSEIDLLELFYYMLEKVWFIVAGAVAGAIIAGIYTLFLVTPMYQSTATLYVFRSKDSVLDVSALTQASQLTNDCVELFKLRTVNEEVIQFLQLPYTVKQLQEMLTVTNPTNTRYLNITVKSADAEEATRIANKFGAVAQETIKSKMKTEEPTVLDEAVTSMVPVSPKKTQNVMVGGLIGALLLMGIFFLIFVMDDKIKSSDDIMKYYGLPTLAVVPLLGAVETRSMASTGHGGHKTHKKGKR